tara:strand:+ start:4688 stop:5647 length:960 start_codon:yes stop_codon:yes gene_type:complete
MKKNTLCLCAIVKNEEKIIMEMILSCINYIDYAVICDTGSIDNTIKTIKELLEFESIPYEIHQLKWYNYAANRNHYIELAKEKTSHILVLDADERLNVTNKNFKDKLDDFHLIRIKECNGPEIKYPNIFRNDSRIEYVGDIHEQPKFPIEFKQGRSLNYDIDIIHTAEGSNRRNKFRRDMMICLDRDPFPNIPGRREYYLGICSLNLKDTITAKEYFLKRAMMKIENDNNDEEKWHAYMMYSFCFVEEKNVEEYSHNLICAYFMRPSRLEPLHLLISALELHGYMEKRNRISTILRDARERVAFPENDRIAINSSLYNK